MGFRQQEPPRDVPFSSMQELLSKTVDSNTPVEDTEFYELTLIDAPHEIGTRYSVRQWHAQWSEIDRQIMWDDEQVEYFWIPDEAKKRYLERKQALAEKGFVYSNMEM